MEKKLYKTNYNKMLEGVCNGFAEYFNADVSLIRIAVVLLGIYKPVLAIILYIALAIILPVKRY